MTMKLFAIAASSATENTQLTYRLVNTEIYTEKLMQCVSVSFKTKTKPETFGKAGSQPKHFSVHNIITITNTRNFTTAKQQCPQTADW